MTLIWQQNICFFFVFWLVTIIAVPLDGNRFLSDDEKGIVYDGHVDDFATLGIMLSKKGVDDFRKQHDLQTNTILHIQKISPRNSVRVNDKEYFLDDLEPFNIFDLDAISMFEGVEEPLPTFRNNHIFSKEDDYESILLFKDVKNEYGNPKSITIFNKQMGTSVDLKPIAPTYLVKVESDDVDIDKLSTQYHLSDGQTMEHNPALTVKNIRTSDDEEGKEENTFCFCEKTIQVAVAYESSFCSELGGKEEAEAEIEEIMASVSQKFGQTGVCSSIKVSHMEGFCSEILDPYKKFIKDNKSGCEGYGLLDKFQRYWQNNRIFVLRDTAHLFSGTGLECWGPNDCTVGCAYVGSICSEKAYGVSYVTFSNNSNMRAVLVAHELGHNYGADHINSSTDYIMYPSVHHASNGFSRASQSAFKRNSYRCVAKRLTPLVPLSPFVDVWNENGGSNSTYANTRPLGKFITKIINLFSG